MANGICRHFEDSNFKFEFINYISTDEFNRIVRWCYENFGKLDRRWSYRMTNITMVGKITAQFWFKSKDDHMLFCLTNSN